MHSYSQDLLLPYPYQTTQWLSTDSPELYQQNLRNQSADWYYRSHPVQYTFNSNGYRCREWSQILWSQSHVVMGCSHAQGVGITDSHTLSAQFDHGVNLAQPGVSVYHIQYNTVKLVEQQIRPQRVTVIVPDLHRSVYWAESDWVDLTVHDFDQRGQHLTPSVQRYYQGFLAQPPMAELSAELAIRSVQALWRSVGVRCDLYTVPTVELSYARQLPPVIDLARDCSLSGAHPGRLTVRSWAEFISSQ